MGNSLASNVVNTAVTSMNNVALNAGQDCVNTVVNSITVGNVQCKGNVDITNIETTVTQQNCSQTNDTNDTVSNAVAEQAKQSAQAINQMFNISGTTETQNVFNATAQLGNAISNAYNETCVSTAIQQIVTPSVVSGGNCTITNEQVATAATNCVQNSTTVVSAKNQLKLAIDQSAKSTVQNFFAYLAFIVAGVLVVGIGIIAILFFAGIVGHHHSHTEVISAPTQSSQEETQKDDQQLELEVEELAKPN